MINNVELHGLSVSTLVVRVELESTLNAIAQNLDLWVIYMIHSFIIPLMIQHLSTTVIFNVFTTVGG